MRKWLSNRHFVTAAGRGGRASALLLSALLLSALLLSALLRVSALSVHCRDLQRAPLRTNALLLSASTRCSAAWWGVTPIPIVSESACG